jgi:hypothetical protein
MSVKNMPKPRAHISPQVCSIVLVIQYISKWYVQVEHVKGTHAQAKHTHQPLCTKLKHFVEV